jgi:hypothetical protein
MLGAAAIIGVTGGAAAARTPDGSNLSRSSWEWRPHRQPSPTPKPTPTPTSPTPAPTTSTRAIIGMSAPADQWDTRVKEVGSGLAARRIFADLASGAGSQMKLVDAANAAGMLPVISYKVGGDASGAIGGKYDNIAQQAAQKLAASGRPVAVTIWHEPNGDLTPAQYVAIHKRLAPFFRTGNLKVGGILNGFLLDRQQSTFAAYCDDELLDMWDYVAIDSYESGTQANPGTNKPADRIPKLLNYLSGAGYPHLPIGVAEYNGYSGTTIKAMGDCLLSTPNVWFGCCWNSTGGSKGSVLTGDRLTAFRQTVADPRAADPLT